MSSTSRWIVVALAIAGLGFALGSTWVHYKILTDPTYISPCNFSATFNCEQVYLSRYGSVAGVPIALAGVLWFGLMMLVAWPSASTGPKTAGSGALVSVLSLVGLAVVLYLGLTSWFVLKVGCVLCIGTYVAVIGIFLTVARTKSLSLGQIGAGLAADLRDTAKRTGVVVLLLALLGGMAYAAMKFPRQGVAAAPVAVQAGVEGLSRAAIADFTSAWSTQPRVNVGVPADGAKVVIVKFNDFQCPPCGITHSAYKPVLEKLEQANPGAIKYVMKDWPWNAKCNFTLPPTGGPNHAGACEAAAAARMARDRGHDPEVAMREWLYSHQQTMDPVTVKGGAESVLGVKDFQAEYERKLPQIREDVSLGASLLIRGTPTFFINGVRVEQILPPAYFELAIQLELNRK